MKGLLFNIVEDVVAEALSADAWDDVIDAAGVDGSYTSLGTYPDADLMAIVGATAEIAGISVDDTLRLAGRLGFKHLAQRAEYLLNGIDGWQQLIEALDDIIHPEVRKIYPDSEVPGFAATAGAAGLRVVYTSSRGLCALADGLIRGGGEWFNSELDVVHESCANAGDPSCTMLVRSLAEPASTP